MTKSLSDQAYEIYQEKGISGVIDWATSRGHKKWSWCRPCDCSVPAHDGECLACGTGIDESHPFNRANLIGAAWFDSSYLHH